MSQTSNATMPDIHIDVNPLDVKPPPLYQVVLLNDDYTPMDFVVHLLITLFNFDSISAEVVMRSVHEKGRGICGVFSLDIANTKVRMGREMARAQGYPLVLVCEPAPAD